MSEREPKPETPNKKEFSLLLIKPNAVKVGLIGVIRQELIEAGFDIVIEKEARLSSFEGELLYRGLGAKKAPVIEHIISGNSHVFLVYGEEVIKRLRELIGCTAGKDRPAKGLRGRYAFDPVQNSAHSADSHREVVEELNYVFTDIKEAILRSQLAEELHSFLTDQQSIIKGERYPNQYAV